MFNRPLTSFVPSVYKGIVEMEDIIKAEQIEVDIAQKEMYNAFANTFVVTADAVGIQMFETMLHIVASPETEDLEFRRQRLINRMSMSPPYTFRFLKQKLDEIMGEGNWAAHIDFNNYTLYIESSASNQSWFSEMAFTVNSVKPCNMVFINVPYTNRTIHLSEQISYSSVAWKYRLGSWKLGRDPFSIMEGGGVAKMPEVKSIQQAMLNDTAAFVSSDINAVLLNDSIRVTEFRSKQVTDNSVSVEYSVTADMTSLITDIKLLKADNTVLTQAAVYVPITQSTICKHNILVKEGV